MIFGKAWILLILWLQHADLQQKKALLKSTNSATFNVDELCETLSCKDMLSLIQSNLLLHKCTYLWNQVLELLKVSKKSTAAVDVLIKMGVFPVHVNLELLKSGVPIAFSDEQVQSAQQILADPFPDTNLVHH